MPINNSSINISAQRDFIRKHGERVDYFQAMKCTCGSSIQMTGSNMPDANRSNPNCKACHGLGLVWTGPTRIIGAITNINQQKDLLMSGIAAPGDLVFSPDLRYTLADYDMIQLTWKEGIPYEGELRTRGSGAVDQTRYPIMSVNECITVDPNTGDITTYKVNTDFTIAAPLQAADRNITWLPGHGPAANTTYSIKYQALMDWIAFVPPQPRRERGTSLGQRIILRKRHLVFSGM